MYFDDLEAVRALAGTPVPKPAPPDRGLWRAALDSVVGAGAKALASAVEVGSALGAAAAFDPTSDASLEAVKRPLEFGQNDVSKPYRDFERRLRPDPATAGKAEEVVYGAVGPVAEFITAGLLGGPAGLAAAAGEMGFSTAEDLRQQGVSLPARTAVGAVTAALAGGGAVVPLVGATPARTLGLWAIGGPGAFMAQQQATRSILGAADYADLAAQYDPLDPVGLAVSTLVPAPFAAYGMFRGMRTGTKAEPAGKEAPGARDRVPAGASVPGEPAKPPVAVSTQEAVDAAMVHNLTLHSDARAAHVPPMPEADAPIVAAPRAGGVAEVVTERGLTAPIRYRLAEADDLITSHTDDLRVDPRFPAELQPRDRTRAASSEQIARIENAIRPELLGESVKASDGAPIVGPDAVVESGNARTIALRRAYAAGRAGAYREWLAGNAERFGLAADQVQDMRRPVLVRERLGDIDRAAFARQANESPVAALSPVEMARADAAMITDLSGLSSNEDGTLNMARSRNWVRQFMSGVSPSERGALMQADGQLSQAGLQRIRNAVFAKAYGDTEMLAALTESADSNVRNILSGLLRAAPDVAALRDLQDAGARHPIDIASDLTRALRQFSRLREEGTTVSQFLSQGALIDAPIPPELNNILLGLAENARAPKRIAAMVTRMVHAIDALGDPRQESLLGGEAPKMQDVAADAVEGMRTLTDEQLHRVEPETIAPKVDAVMASVQDRVRALEEASPELRVSEDATVKEFLDRARREARDGTETELGAMDADLVRVAAECALSMS